jgi:integrating conjugative element protein (TIGR03746 family)
MVSQENVMQVSNVFKEYKGWITHAWRKEDADAKVIKLQKYFIGILLVVCTAFCIGWMMEPKQLTVYIPPDIRNGATMKVGTIPLPLIYSFTYEIWQELNYWPADGETDYKNNIHNYWSYLTPKFKTELLEDYDELKASGQLQRIRHLQGISGAAYDSINVKTISDDTWEVDLKMRLTEYKNNQAVKDIEVMYPLKITRVNVSTKNNPYGLVIAGYVSEPRRSNTDNEGVK